MARGAAGNVRGLALGGLFRREPTIHRLAGQTQAHHREDEDDDDADRACPRTKSTHYWFVSGSNHPHKFPFGAPSLSIWMYSRSSLRCSIWPGVS